MYSMRRDQQLDQPALVFYALIGNDVCNGHPGDGSFTPVDVFEQKARAGSGTSLVACAGAHAAGNRCAARVQVLTTLDYLDTKLPAGSHVVFIGLADGRVLWNSMHTRIHPIGVRPARCRRHAGADGSQRARRCRTRTCTPSSPAPAPTPAGAG